jgi:hypothetical protein
MKKRILLFTGLLALFSKVNAQSSNEDSIFKPVAGEKTFELFINPFSATPITFNNVRLRKFATENKAYRLGGTFGFISQAPNFNLNLSLMSGIEKHFKGTKRLSPYVGGELSILGSFSSSSIKDIGTKVTTKNSGSFSDGSNRSMFGFGLNALVGTDFYVSKHLYLGIEAGYGITVNQILKNVNTVIVDGGVTTTTTTDGNNKFSLGTNLGTNLNGGIRIGFVF